MDIPKPRRSFQKAVKALIKHINLLKKAEYGANPTFFLNVSRETFAFFLSHAPLIDNTVLSVSDKSAPTFIAKNISTCNYDVEPRLVKFLTSGQFIRTSVPRKRIRRGKTGLNTGKICFLRFLGLCFT
jgi:hypothetical protein